jgi:2-C-methyl-D-erythritol 2,4-cyclodiphosphate synthase
VKSIRIGSGFDVHQLVENYPLIIGGVKIEHPKGALGHSDADVLLHALADALLGAAALGDLGTHFPDTDPSCKNMDSLLILSKVCTLVKSRGYSINNIDSTVVLQSPKINNYISKMRENIAQVIGVETDQVSVKATTTEGLGFAGREEGIAAYATVLIQQV